MDPQPIITRDDDHIYHVTRVVNGESKTHTPIGVTSLLSSVGISPTYYNSERAREFGTMGHDVVNLFLEDDLGEYDPAFEPWMEGIVAFRAACRPSNYILEKFVYSSKYDYAGQLDFCGMVTPPGKRRELYCLDWKFWSKYSDAAKSAGEIQLEGYSRAAIEQHLVKRMPYKALVHFYPHGFKFYFCHDPSSWGTLLGALNVEKWKRRFG